MRIPIGLTLIALCLAWVGCNTPTDFVSVAECTVDDECQLVRDECTGCGYVAMHDDEVAAFRGNVSQQICDVTVEDPFCSFSGRPAAACDENKCVYELYLFCGLYSENGDEIGPDDSCPLDRTCVLDTRGNPECVPALSSSELQEGF